jgi:N-acetylglucosamine malate deacetylase 1
MKPTFPMNSPDPSSLLVFAAHPDDIEFGCGGVIARETQAGAKAHFVIGSRGESATNGTPAEPVRKAEKSAAILGATLEFVEIGGNFRR